VEEVKVTIDEEGNVKVSVFGMKGDRCLEVTRKLEALLGGEVEREFTSEYYEEEQTERERATVEDKA